MNSKPRMLRRYWNRQTGYQLYLWGIILIGASLIIAALAQLPMYTPLANFLLLLGLAAFAESAATSVQVSTKAGITFGVGTAVAMAAVPTFGIFAAILTAAIINIGVWLIKPKDDVTWKKSGVQLGFNTGMHTISILIAGLIFTAVVSNNLLPTLLAQILGWLLAAICYDQINFWLIMFILRLQHGPEFNVWTPWRENLWAVPMNILVMSIGGALIAYAMVRFDWIGILIFYVPVFLSAYAFRLYVRQMQDHMDNLENIVAERTRELEEQKAELSELNQQKDIYLSILSHDIKTALTGVSIYASLLEEQPELILENHFIGKDMMQSLRVVNEIVDDIVTLDRIEAGHEIKQEREEFRLTDAITMIANSLRAVALQKNIRFSVTRRENDIWLHADRQKIERAMLNIISNAIKYTPRDGTVKILIKREAEQAIVRVTDTGYGIPEHELPYIFERYSRVAKTSKRAAGSGLGLAIAKIYIEAHQGNIQVKSTEGKGTVFTVSLPGNSAIPPTSPQKSTTELVFAPT